MKRSRSISSITASRIVARRCACRTASWTAATRDIWKIADRIPRAIRTRSRAGFSRPSRQCRNKFSVGGNPITARDAPRAVFVRRSNDCSTGIAALRGLTPRGARSSTFEVLVVMSQVGSEAEEDGFAEDALFGFGREGDFADEFGFEVHGDGIVVGAFFDGAFYFFEFGEFGGD